MSESSFSLTPGTLREVLARRIARISEEQHALSRERTMLEEQERVLRMGFVTPEAVLLSLQTKGIRLRGVTIRTEARRRGTMASTRRAES